MSTTPIEDDSWSDLAAELGVDSTSPPKPAADPEPEPALDSEYEPPEAESEHSDHHDQQDAVDAEPDDTVVIPALHAEPLAEANGGESGGDQPGGRKRRRRRRRRKKGAPGQPADANGPVEAGPAEDDAGEDEEFEDDAEPDGAAAATEETTPEAARDIIANWNVPSWEEIVAGLYRPER